MTPDNAYEIDFVPAIPSVVRKELSQRLRGTTKIDIYEQVAEGKQRKVNSLRLQTRSGMFPNESVEEICTAVTAIMQLAWEEQETEDPEVGPPPMEFVVVCEQAGKGRKRSQFLYVYRGEREPDYAEEEIGATEHAIHRVLELQERTNDRITAHLNDAHRLILDIVKSVVTQSTASQNAGAQLMDRAWPMLMAANQSHLHAKAAEYNLGRAELKEKATTERIETALRTLGPVGSLILSQLAGKALGVEIPVGVAPAPAVREPHPGGNGAPAHEDEDDEGPPEHVLASIAQAFGGGLSVRQRRDLNRQLTKKQLGAFDALFCAETDAEAVAAYQGVVDHAMDKLGTLQQLLEPDQTQMLAAFIAAATERAQQDAPQPEA